MFALELQHQKHWAFQFEHAAAVELGCDVEGKGLVLPEQFDLETRGSTARHEEGVAVPEFGVVDALQSVKAGSGEGTCGCLWDEDEYLFLLDEETYFFRAIQCFVIEFCLLCGVTCPSNLCSLFNVDVY
jgi:hypothetical protein